MIGRREFCAAVGVYALIEAAGETGALAQTPSRGAAAWIEAQQEIAAALRHGRLRPGAWQRAVEDLAVGVDLPELLAQTDFERLKASFDFSDGQPSKRFVRLAGERSPELSYGLAFFGFKRGQVITPHGHRNMASAHMAVAGRFRVRTFDRLGEAPGGLIVRPSGDRLLQPGQISSMSSERDNIHWFVAEDDESATLDVIIDAIAPGEARYVIDLIDPIGGSRQADGRWFAPFIPWEQSVVKYAQA